MTALIRSALGRFGRGARRLHEDDEGAALVFATITLFSLALATLMVLQLGLVSTDRMQTQTSADAAAYSGALVEANALNAIGQINDGMAYTHYASLRYVVDQIVYGTLAEFLNHPQWVRQNASSTLSQTPQGATTPGIPSEFGGGIENKRAPDWVMIGDANTWNQRWPRLQANGRAAVQGGIAWLQDLEGAAHLILRETPRLVQEKVAEVAFKNGASHVAISSDLQKAFAATADGSGAEGFIDAVGDTSGGANRVAPSLPFRYAQRSILVDNKPRPFPSWFDPELGKSRGIGYTQIRLCWNVNDWAHRSPSKAEFHVGFPYRAGSPNGHWHAKHEHHYIEYDSSGFPVPKVQEHGGLTGGAGGVREASTGTGFGGGHIMPTDDDSVLHTKARTSGIDPLAMNPHHAVVKCPTCWHNDRSASSMYSEFSKEQGYITSNLTLELDFGGNLPKPLMLDADGDVLRSSVTVATWRESWGIGTVLPKSEWGMIAVASAQVGLMDTQGRVHALRSVSGGRATYAGQGGVTTINLRRDLDRDYVNLFHGLDPNDRTGKAPGLRFGARLVQIGRDLTHPRTAVTSDPVDELLKDTSTRWFTTDDTGASISGTAARPSATEAGAPQPLAALRNWVAATNLRAVKEVFWH